ncbi:tRNA threonylcarbamoyladenosine dehydratase [Anaerosalibacter massiliensis]|uniref:tRNA threonylcarbamoyladenosine dehydratase n=1 Tax=Anaerosalibacter massiliensis TaxID=1347392 RepID=A0A9X2MFB2_9FIRM|nr:tRNA threonylcarbamoyladenosine dehydratase [Anaerosalibacter massiliensis]MCR2042536.1 tRNA threonylcarbamoyladenosine dehydratase [Anaerosalibacter massiliensis]
MDNSFLRTELLLGRRNMDILKKSKVCVFGIGGVGSYAAEALVRSGIGNIVLVDYDIIDISNINRQIHATHSTVGKYKVEIMKERILDINPWVNIKVFNTKVEKSNLDFLLKEKYDYVIDAIDMVTSKLALIERCSHVNMPIISCMGAGNKLDPTVLEVGDIYETSVCPLAKVMRRELRKRNIDSLKVIWSREKPIKVDLIDQKTGKPIPGSVSFVPPVAGLMIASEVVKDLIS